MGDLWIDPAECRPCTASNTMENMIHGQAEGESTLLKEISHRVVTSVSRNSYRGEFSWLRKELVNRAFWPAGMQYSGFSKWSKVPIWSNSVRGSRLMIFYCALGAGWGSRLAGFLQHCFGTGPLGQSWQMSKCALSIRLQTEYVFFSCVPTGNF